MSSILEIEFWKEYFACDICGKMPAYIGKKIKSIRSCYIWVIISNIFKLLFLLLISNQQLADSSQCLADCYLSSCKVFILREISGICPLLRPGKQGRYLLCGIIGGQNGIVNLSQELSPHGLLMVSPTPHLQHHHLHSKALVTLIIDCYTESVCLKFRK